MRCARRRAGSTRWPARPVRRRRHLLAAAELALAVLDERDIDDALAGHPRIGERSKHASRALEQAGVGDDVRAALAPATGSTRPGSATSTWSAASGRTGEELLAILGERLSNDPARERAVVREELGAINRLRLQRLVEEQ